MKREAFTSNEKSPPIKRERKDAIGKNAIPSPQGMRRWLEGRLELVDDMGGIREVKIEAYNEIIDAYFVSHMHLAYGFWLYPEELEISDEHG